MTERCEFLEQSGKVVNALLSFNVMRQADKFVTGMQIVNGLSDELVAIKEISAESRKSVGYMKSQVVLKASQALVLKR